tara:strand:- start:292 stop:612 length:321 start_codon:yes stop_codon:yes gene_type:complete
MSWKDAIKKEEEKPKGTWPMGTSSQQKKEFGEVMFDEYGRDADERGELSPSGDEKKKKELLEYLEEIEGKIAHTKRSLEQGDTKRVLLRFKQFKAISEDAIEVIKE